ncbi:hypothetical protein ACFX2C_007596 [Malus domestica]
MRSVVDEIIKVGRQLAKKGQSLLMYEWRGKKYWGAAHGLAGIMHIKNRFPSSNFPSRDGSESDRLVHWCHGAPGVALTLVRAAEVFGDEEFLRAAIDAGEVVWNWGLLKRVGICHGISGNTYVFLSLYRLTGKRPKTHIRGGRCMEEIGPILHSKVLVGGRYMTEPSEARFPGFEL